MRFGSRCSSSRARPRRPSWGCTTVGLKIALDAPPVDGAANDALLRFLAKTLGLRQRDVALVCGDKSRKKSVAIQGSSEPAIRALATRP